MILDGIKLKPQAREEYTKGLIACSHPGKMGDVLYALPTMRHIAKSNKAKIDFYTSEYCTPILRLIEHQEYINAAYTMSNYKIHNTRCGVQPWRMPVALNGYDKVIHMGFRREPDQRLDHFIARQSGISESQLDGIVYEHVATKTLSEPYVVLSPFGRKQHLYMDTLHKFIRKCPLPIVQIGGPGEFIESDTVDKTGLDFLDTLPWIANAKGFVGLLSANLVLANGFNIPKVCLLPRKHWKSHHAVQGANNHYLLGPRPKEILRRLGL